MDYLNKRFKVSKLGFTLIELLMVISVITLISSIFLSYIGSASAKSRDSVRLSDIKQINTATTMYYEDKGELPESIGITTGVDPSKTLVGAGYLSAEPKDPKTGNSYTFKKGTINGKPVAVASATYETIYTEDGSKQKVGVIVGDVDMSNICNLIQDFINSTGQIIDVDFPSCDLSNTSNDQIIGVTSGHRRGGSRIVTDDISNCSVSDVNKKCPDSIVGVPCYCDSKINNIDVITISQSDCTKLINSGLSLYWSDEIYSPIGCYDVSCMLQGVCMDSTVCYNSGKVWFEFGYNGTNVKCTIPEEPPPTDEELCVYGGGTWLSAVEVCLTQENCENYSNSPYNMYWSTEASLCLLAESRITYLDQDRCEGRGGNWLISGSDYQCTIYMSEGQCTASGGDIWSGNLCIFSSNGADMRVID